MSTLGLIKIDNYNPNNFKFKLINGIDNQGLAAQYFKIKDGKKQRKTNTASSSYLNVRERFL